MPLATHKIQKEVLAFTDAERPIMLTAISELLDQDLEFKVLDDRGGSGCWLIMPLEDEVTPKLCPTEVN